MNTEVVSSSNLTTLADDLDIAALNEVPLMIVYEKTDEPPQHRLVSPSEVWEAKDSSLILSAFDHGREEPRSFRLDRIERIYDAPDDTDYIAIERKDG